jgi:hypothetical protein
MNARDLIRELSGTICRCGEPKTRGRTFCRACYFSLPSGQAKALYHLEQLRVGEGYEEAYAAAVRMLDRSAGATT